MFSATAHLGGKMTKSAIATPGTVDCAVSTVKMDGSYRSKIAMKCVKIIYENNEIKHQYDDSNKIITSLYLQYDRTKHY